MTNLDTPFRTHYDSKTLSVGVRSVNLRELSSQVVLQSGGPGQAKPEDKERQAQDSGKGHADPHTCKDQRGNEVEVQANSG